MYNLRSKNNKLKRSLKNQDKSDESPENKKSKLYDPDYFKGDASYENSSDSEGEDKIPSDIDSLKDFIVDDDNPLISVIGDKLISKFPKLDREELDSVIKSSIEEIDEVGMFDFDYLDGEDPWKRKLPKKEVKKLEPVLKRMRKNIKNNTPTIDKILKANLTDAEKEKALQLYDVLDTETISLSYLNIQDKLNQLINNAPSELNRDLDKELKELKNKMREDQVSIEKILTAKITESDKIKALKLYECMQECSYCDSSWVDYQNEINSILKSQLKSDEEIERINELEKKLKANVRNHNADLKVKIFELDADDKIKYILYDIYNEMITSNSDRSRYNELRTKLLWALKLPYRKKSNIDIKLDEVYNKLNRDIYGMNEAKEKILQAINDRISNPSSRTLLALKGKPGVGKTKLVKTIAKATGLAYEKVNLGGTIDSTIFKGSDTVWSGANPSIILQILARCECCDPIISLDELDKLASTKKGIDVENSLLHILDPSQNKEFNDNYLNEFQHDISNVWFIITINDESKLNPALRDRLNIIEIPSYSKSDIAQIVKKHTLPEMLIDKGLSPNDILITDEAINTLLSVIGSDAVNNGIRPIERAIQDIVSKINLLKSNINIPLSYKLPNFNSFPYTLTPESIRYLVKINQNNHDYKNMYI